MKKTLLILVAAAASIAIAAQARVSNHAEMTGYNTCVNASEGQFHGLVLSRDYFVAQNPGAKSYYINGTAWENGDRIAVRIACDTSNNGRDLKNVTTGSGRFALHKNTDPVRVAVQ